MRCSKYITKSINGMNMNEDHVNLQNYDNTVAP